MFISYRQIQLELANTQKQLAEKQAELDNLSAQKKLLFDSIDEMLWSIKIPSWKILELSSSCQNIFGISAEELSVKIENWRDLIYPDDIKILLINNEALFTGQSIRKQFRIIHSDGSPRWVELKIIPVLDNDGKLNQLNGTTRDITKEKKAGKALMESESLFRQFFDKANEAIVVMDTHTGFMCDYNNSFLDLMSCTGTEVLAMTPAAMSIPVQPDGSNSDEKAEEYIQATLKGHSPSFEWWFRNSQGRIIPGEVRLSLIQSKELKLIRASIIDITERKKAEEEIRASEERYRLVSENPSLGIAWANVDGCVIRANAAFCHMLKYKEEELIGLNFAKFTHPDDLNTELLLFQKMLNGELSNYRIEKRYLNKDGEIYWVELNLSSFLDEKGFVKFFIGVVQDITARKKAEDEVRALNESLELKVRERTAALREANEELETFNFTVSHDLQAPVRAIGGFAEILLSHYGAGLDEEGREMVQIMLGSAQRMSRLIRELLEFAKLGRVEKTILPVNMEAIVKVVIDEMSFDHLLTKTEFKLKNINSAHCDPILIRQVWTNLISNAIKYSSKKEHPIVEIGSEQKDNLVTYYVKDNGTGFDMRYAHKLFSVFKRLHSNDEFEGTGIGLATVHRIITRQGGHVWANASPGEGATFYFTLNA